MAKVETGTKARQGEKGKPVLYVLVAAILLAAVAGAGVLTWQGSVSPPDHASQTGEAARQTAADPTTAPSIPAEPKAH